MSKKRLAALAGLATLALSACTPVPPGYVGVKVNLYGGDKGVDSEEVGVGRYLLTPNQEMYLFPTFMQNYTWTASRHEGKPIDESFTFQTKEGLAVNADIGISYSIDPAKVVNVFQKYRKGVDEITDIYLRNMVRDALVNEASSRPIEYVYGEGKAALIKQVQADVEKETKDIGIIIDHIYWIGELRLPSTVTAAINAKIAATQMSQQRENEVAQAKAEAQKKIEEARGVADSQLLVAQAEAEAIKVKGEAEASAITAKQQALHNNPDFVKLLYAERWNGQLPTYTLGNSVPFINLKETESK